MHAYDIVKQAETNRIGNYFAFESNPKALKSKKSGNIILQNR